LIVVLIPIATSTVKPISMTISSIDSLELRVGYSGLGQVLDEVWGDRYFIPVRFSRGVVDTSKDMFGIL
jgi:hypothetical protein